MHLSSKNIFFGDKNDKYMGTMTKLFLYSANGRLSTENTNLNCNVIKTTLLSYFVELT